MREADADAGDRAVRACAWCGETDEPLTLIGEVEDDAATEPGSVWRVMACGNCMRIEGLEPLDPAGKAASLQLLGVVQRCRQRLEAAVGACGIEEARLTGSSMPADQEALDLLTAEVARAGRLSRKAVSS